MYAIRSYYEAWTSTFDVVASCASFTIALDNAARIMATDSTIKCAVVIGVYNMPAYLRSDDAFGYSLFADGAGAVVLERTEEYDAGYIRITSYNVCYTKLLRNP